MEGAAGACCLSTGMAATVTVMSAFLKAGEYAIFFGGVLVGFKVQRPSVM